MRSSSMKLCLFSWYRMGIFVLIFLSFWATKAIPNEQIYQNFSLFYTDDELAIQETKKQHAIQTESIHKIHLQALFYSNAQTWIVWINGHQLSATTSHTLYKIHRITPHYVILDWWHGGKTHRIGLQPNQSYDALSGQVSEGS